jgi:NAD(P)-dependent dehydrogenase (short-subunit alcohol dehydrogenase family)
MSTTETKAETSAPAAAPPAGRLKGKVALVTGSTRGIGRAVAHAFAGEGARVAICGRSKEDLLAVAEEVRLLGAECCAIKIDLRDYKSAIKLVDGVQRAFGRIDVLVNNASVLGSRKTLMETSAEEWDEVIRTNLDSLFWVTKEALGKMVPQNAGSIINVSSGVGRVGRARWGAYAVSKFGLEGMTQVLADELKEYKVRVNSVNPGATRTQMRAAAFPGEDPSTLPRPADITNIFVYLASDASAGVNGEQFEARDWMHRTDF